jgi:hypothetical protein
VRRTHPTKDQQGQGGRWTNLATAFRVKTTTNYLKSGGIGGGCELPGWETHVQPMGANPEKIRGRMRVRRISDVRQTTAPEWANRHSPHPNLNYCPRPGSHNSGESGTAPLMPEAPPICLNSAGRPSDVRISSRFLSQSQL